MTTLVTCPHCLGTGEGRALYRICPLCVGARKCPEARARWCVQGLNVADRDQLSRDTDAIWQFRHRTSARYESREEALGLCRVVLEVQRDQVRAALRRSVHLCHHSRAPSDAATPDNPSGTPTRPAVVARSLREVG